MLLELVHEFGAVPANLFRGGGLAGAAQVLIAPQQFSDARVLGHDGHSLGRFPGLAVQRAPSALQSFLFQNCYHLFVFGILKAGLSDKY
jgi:hypothetical protein